MARQAKQSKFYSYYGNEFTGTMAEFLAEHPEVVRNNLYRERGATTTNGDIWRINEVPKKFKQERMSASRTWIFKHAQQQLIEAETEEEKKQAEELIDSYKRYYYIAEYEEQKPQAQQKLKKVAAPTELRIQYMMENNSKLSYEEAEALVLKSNQQLKQNGYEIV